jgi:hypothetical protein
MIANKITVTIVVEVLAVEVVPGLLEKAAEHISGEFHTGSLTASDGDTVTWSTGTATVRM